MNRLAQLKALSPFLNLSALARYLGVSRNGLHIRIERGSPELTTVESEKLTALFTDPINTLKGTEFEKE